MAPFEYAFIRLNEGLYEQELREKLGTYFDTAVNHNGMRGQEAANLLVSSGLAEHLERQNPAFVAGKSGTELLSWACEQVGLSPEVANPPRTPTTPDYWVGYMLGLFQVAAGWTYRQVFERMSYADLRGMHSWCQDMSEREVVDTICDELLKRPQQKALRRMRKASGLTQSQLAAQAGLSMRTIQQYEEGQKDINKAAVGNVRKLALILHCTIEDLLEPVM